MEIKILCHCGVKYKFDVEPIDGQMPFAVKCPSCAVDATEHANAHIRQSLGIQVMPSLAPVQIASFSPAASEASVLSPPTATPRLRVAGHAPAPAVASVATATEAPPPPPIRPMVQAAAVPARAKGRPNFGLGVVGALVGAMVGVGLWLLIHNFIGTKSKFLILGVGFFAGLGARFLSRDEGSQQLGMIAGAVTLAGVFGAQYWIAYQDYFGGDTKAAATEMYDEALADAKKVLAQMPNESDGEIRQYLANNPEDEEDKVDPKSITAEDIKYFREETLPGVKALVNGMVALKDYQQETERNVEELKQSSGMKLLLIARGFGMFRLGLLIASCGLAYRMSANAA